jgi:hypothetical protein
MDAFWPFVDFIGSVVITRMVWFESLMIVDSSFCCPGVFQAVQFLRKKVRTISSEKPPHKIPFVHWLEERSHVQGILHKSLRVYDDFAEAFWR